MKTKGAKKKFDCVEFKRKAHERINRETEGMTTQQEAEYFQKAVQSGPLAAWWNSLRAPAFPVPSAAGRPRGS